MAKESTGAGKRTPTRLTASERAAAERAAIYCRVPKIEYAELAQLKSRDFQRIEEQHGVPIRGRFLDLAVVLPALHRALDRQRNQGGPDPNVRFREERAKLIELQRLEKEGTLIHADKIRGGLLRMAAVYRQAGDTLRRRFGDEAVDVINHAIDEAERLVLQTFEKA